MIDCTTAVKQLWNFIEQSMEADDRNQMEEHLAFCKRCCGELEFAEEFQEMLKGAASPELPDDVGSRLSRFIDQIEENGA